MTLQLPNIGLGTAGVDDPDVLAGAIEMGYRFIDTAQRYGNETAVGTAIERASVSRDEIVLASKVHERNLAPEDVRNTTAESLERLGVDRIDLMYVHWPTEAYDPASTLPAFDALRDDGAIEHVGVSNFSPDRLEEATDHLDAPIAANQVEMHPLLPQETLRAYHAQHDIALVAYAPLMAGEFSSVPEFHDVADAVGLTPAQVSLAWISAKGAHPIPRGDTIEHARENFVGGDVTLPADAIEILDAIDRTTRVYPHDEVYPDD